MRDKYPAPSCSRMPHELRLESEVSKHRLHAGFVRTPPVRTVAGQFSARVEDHRRTPVEPCVKVRLDDKAVLAHRSGTLEAEQRVAQVVEDAEKKNHIETPD